MSLKSLLRWLPAIVMMAVIFAFSSTPSDDLPSYGFWDTLVKKGGHMTGYGLLALAFWFGLNQPRDAAISRHYVIAWFVAVLYAVSDEIHQSFVPGRHPSPLDVLVFDAGGAALALVFLYIWTRFRKPIVPLL